jgi:hypothetical protein
MASGSTDPAAIRHFARDIPTAKCALTRFAIASPTAA